MPRPLPPTTSSSPSFFFFNDTATTEIYTLSLHDALPISSRSCGCSPSPAAGASRRSGFSDRRRLLGEGAGSRHQVLIRRHLLGTAGRVPAQGPRPPIRHPARRPPPLVAGPLRQELAPHPARPGRERP